MTLSIVLASYRLVRLIPSVAKSEWPIWVSRSARPDLLTLEGRTDCGSMVGKPSLTGLGKNSPPVTREEPAFNSRCLAGRKLS
jgi:hypothetical protein